MIRVTLAWAPAPRDVQERELALPAGASVADAVQACAEAAAWRAAMNAAGEASEKGGMGQTRATGESVQAGIWGRIAGWDALLHDGDRVELCRPLKVDPKAARRQRFARQGARGTGLFARQRSGGKAGY